MTTLNGKTGIAYKDGSPVATVGLLDDRGPDPIRRGVMTGHVQVIFTSFESNPGASALDDHLRKQKERKERTQPFTLDIELDDGTRLNGCTVHTWWGGELGQNRYGLETPES